MKQRDKKKWQRLHYSRFFAVFLNQYRKSYDTFGIYIFFSKYFYKERFSQTLYYTPGGLRRGGLPPALAPRMPVIFEDA